MKSLYIDCPTGLAGDMLLASLIDLGVPKEIIQEPLDQIGYKDFYNLKYQETDTFGIHGGKLVVEECDSCSHKRDWKNLKEIILNSKWNESLKRKILSVYNILAEAESIVHRCKIEDVHFHEIGSIESFVDVVGVCAAIEYLGPLKIICSNPPSGIGSVKCSHGILSVPVPVVAEMAKKYQINLLSGNNESEGELTTPTGLALMISNANDFGYPSFFNISNIGIGIGKRCLGRPNFIRIFSLNYNLDQKTPMNWQSLVLQEAFVDDSTPEDISHLISRLKDSGAIEVVCKSVQMKKGRDAFSVTAILNPEDASKIRLIWFEEGSTIGLRERYEGRWVLPRRSGYCLTSYGKVNAKQTKRPNGVLSLKFEHDELIRLSMENQCSIEEIRRNLFKNSAEFIPIQDWSC